MPSLHGRGALQHAEAPAPWVPSIDGIAFEHGEMKQEIRNYEPVIFGAPVVDVIEGTVDREALFNTLGGQYRRRPALRHAGVNPHTLPY